MTLHTERKVWACGGTWKVSRSEWGTPVHIEQTQQAVII